MKTRKKPDLIKDVCNIVGHDIVHKDGEISWCSKCNRCGKATTRVKVYVDGILMAPGEDYIEASGAVTFLSPLRENSRVTMSTGALRTDYKVREGDRSFDVE